MWRSRTKKNMFRAVIFKKEKGMMRQNSGMGSNR